MSNKITVIMIVILIIGALTSRTRAELATIEGARRMAMNWITQTLHREGTWGESETAQIDHIQKFKRGDKVLGYYCKIKPKGFILISLLKGLAPIKAYSGTSDLDPNSDEGPADLLKLKMGQILTGIERQLGELESVTTEDLLEISDPDIDHLSTWEKLDVDPKEFRPWYERSVLKLGRIGGGYQPGTWLLRSLWGQNDPYNRMCPAGHNGCSAAHCAVGCAATMGAQVFRHWCWPPRSYLDWPNMPQVLIASSPHQEIFATSNLCYLVGQWADMDWCADEDKPCASSASFSDMEDVFEDNGYADCEWETRNLTKTIEWWNVIKSQINLNRPIPYEVERHGIVVDGWDYGYRVHTNYGGFSSWFSIDELYLKAGSGESMIINIYPNVSVGGLLHGSYIKPYSYYYLDRNSSGGPATFNPGVSIQLLHDITVFCVKDYIKFHGLTNLETRLFTRGDRTRGICIKP